MWDEELNKKIKEAADQYHRAYEETAWDKMETMLNEQLPVQKKKKRRYFLLPFLALLLGSLFFIVYPKQINNNNKPAANTILKTTSQHGAITTTSNQLAEANNQTAKTIASSNLQGNKKKTVAQIEIAIGPNENFFNSSNKKLINNKSFTKSNYLSGTEVSSNNSSDHTANAIKSQQQNENTSGVTINKTNMGKPSTIENDVVENKKPVAENKQSSITNKDDSKNKDSKRQPNKKVLNQKSFLNNFAIDFSAGPDVSAIDFGNVGKAAINYGLGLSYALSKKFTLRSGFYISDKIYSANKNKYDIPSSPNFIYLTNIDANCKVYEIPLTVSYSFEKKKNHQWFAAAGVSSYLMKKESYDYYYKYPGGNTDSKAWSISNQNQNYFSVLDLSGGYQYSLNPKLSLRAEPYVKVPLSRVGAGKVKLNSTGILFTLSLKPFYKK